jgi:hypothetical protein
MRFPGDVCETCRHFDSSSHSSATKDGGMCRAHAPVADDRNGLARWPTVDWADWCAEYARQLEPVMPEPTPAPAPADPFDDIPF